MLPPAIGSTGNRKGDFPAPRFELARRFVQAKLFFPCGRLCDRVDNCALHERQILSKVLAELQQVKHVDYTITVIVKARVVVRVCG